MAFFRKRLVDSGREMYLYYPGEKCRTPFKRCAITFLLDSRDEAPVRELLFDRGLAGLADRNDVILSFPIPTERGWNYSMDPGRDDDVAAFRRFQDAMAKSDDLPAETDEAGIPTVKSMLGSWHPMNDARYLVGVGTGASMAFTLAALYPENIAAALTVGGALDSRALANATYAPMPISIVRGDRAALEYFVKANGADEIDETAQRIVYRNRVNPLQCAVLDRANGELSVELILKVWDRMFSAVRRPNTGPRGDCEPRMGANANGFEYFIDDARLDGTPHTWFTHVPSVARGRPNARLPLLIFFHGGSDNPAEAAEMSKFHDVGEAEGFITVYPWGTNRCSWNSEMNPSLEDDVGFVASLIEYMTATYPVDPGRVYLSGFSNGAALAQAAALAHPELVAAICPIDSNWPGDRLRASEVDWRDVRPYANGMRKKADYDYRIPVWYTYGSREPAYPVHAGCTQQHQYDFWKMYNNIEIRPTPGRDRADPTGCGVRGDESETLAPSKRHPHHAYDVQRFYSRDERPLNLYNFVVMREKGHDIAHMDATLGWNFVRRFRRNPDGSLGLVEGR